MTYQVKVNEKGVNVIHYDLLKPYKGPDIPIWVHITSERLVKNQ